VLYICALVGCNKNNIKMYGTCIKIIVPETYARFLVNLILDVW